MFIAKNMAIIWFSVVGGGHLGFSDHQWSKKMETVFFCLIGVYTSEKSPLCKIYMKSSTEWHNNVYYYEEKLHYTP